MFNIKKQYFLDITWLRPSCPPIYFRLVQGDMHIVLIIMPVVMQITISVNASGTSYLIKSLKFILSRSCRHALSPAGPCPGHRGGLLLQRTFVIRKLVLQL